LWQTDFTYFKVIGWGWFYLSTILDDYSRYIIAWRLCTMMQAADVTQTQGKIERWHQSLKNCVLLEHYYLPGELEQSVGEFVAYYNHQRYHESLSNVTPADVYFGDT